ncbi:MAG: permease-like cell division protein FtsX, partial [Gammaproteobacteria bacterium]|nr:permease-like cell division protein FtsX [Gammaproteobacteria bacterium]
LFLKQNINERQSTALAKKLRTKNEISKVDYISREQALEEFSALSGFGDALLALDENPLPTVLVVHPAMVINSSVAIEALLTELRTHPEVDLAQLDMQWVERLYAMLDTLSRGIWILASLLSLAVLLVVGNTIRLAIQNRRDEIVIIKLIGGTDAFIRRPFLYAGFWYGLFGGIIAFILVQISLLFLQEPVHHLANLYHSQFKLNKFELVNTFVLLTCATLLGYLGSWLAVNRHLRTLNLAREKLEKTLVMSDTYVMFLKKHVKISNRLDA